MSDPNRDASQTEAAANGGTPTPAAGPRLTARLSVMMFLQYGSLGLWSVTVGTYIASNTGQAGLGIFDAGFIGDSLSAGALGALLAPLLFGVIADRHFSSEKMLAALHALTAACLWVMVESRSQWMFFAAMVAYFQVYAPTGPITSSLALRHLPDAAKQFPLVRAMGTAGWIVAGLIVGFAWRRLTGASIEATAAPMQIAIAAHVLMALYSLTLPATPPLGESTLSWRAMAGGADLWRNRSFLVLITASALVFVPAQFYNGFANPFLNLNGYEDAAGKMAILGQGAEFFVMLSMTVLLARFGLKALIVAGALAWVARFLLLAGCSDGQNGWLAYPAILLHGACFAFIYVTSQLYIDRLADRDARAAAQGVHTVAVFGVGHLGGALVSGWAQATYLTPEGVDPPPFEWQTFWLVACGMSLVATAFFALCFKEDRP